MDEDRIAELEKLYRLVTEASVLADKLGAIDITIELRNICSDIADEILRERS